MNFIQDGKGRGFVAAVDSTNRLSAAAVSITERQQAVLEGDAFEIGVPPIALTGTAETAFLFVKNLEDRDLVISTFEFSGAESTGGTSAVTLLKLYTNATTITNSSTGGSVNALIGSNATLNSTVLVGNGSTSAVTGGSLFGAAYVRYAGQALFTGPWVLQRGNSIVLTVTPPASNTSLPFGVRLTTHLQRRG